jgi:hypothetical protein
MAAAVILSITMPGFCAGYPVLSPKKFQDVNSPFAALQAFQIRITEQYGTDSYNGWIQSKGLWPMADDGVTGGRCRVGTPSSARNSEAV